MSHKLNWNQVLKNWDCYWPTTTIAYPRGRGWPLDPPILTELSRTCPDLTFERSLKSSPSFYPSSLGILPVHLPSFFHQLRTPTPTPLFLTPPLRHAGSSRMTRHFSRHRVNPVTRTWSWCEPSRVTLTWSTVRQAGSRQVGRKLSNYRNDCALLAAPAYLVWSTSPQALPQQWTSDLQTLQIVKRCPKWFSFANKWRDGTLKNKLLNWLYLHRGVDLLRYS